MIQLYAGFDPREEVGYHTFCSSVIHNASRPVTITPLHLDTMRRFYFAGHRDGTNAFVYSRFLVPWLQQWRGFAIFADGCDMLCLGDIAELWEMADPKMAVQVVRHQYHTKHPRKYVGTAMEAANRDYPRKNWSSLMLINCAHPSWRSITPDSLIVWSGEQLHQFAFLPEPFLGDLPAEWNWLADEYEPNPKAKLLHWTAGIPAWPAYTAAPRADEWAQAALKVTHATA